MGEAVELVSEERGVVQTRAGLLEPVASAQALVANMETYQGLCDALLSENDYQRIGDKRYKTKSAWRKLSVALGASDRIVRERYETDSQGRIVRAIVVAEASSPGRRTEAVGGCSLTEDCCEAAFCRNTSNGHRHCDTTGCTGRRHYSHPEHDIIATAQTRAKNRALSDLFGFGEVSAEEVAGRNRGDRHQDDRGGNGRQEEPGRWEDGHFVPEGFETFEESKTAHNATWELALTVPEDKRDPLRAHRAEHGWPMSKANLARLGELAAEALKPEEPGIEQAMIDAGITGQMGLAFLDFVAPDRPDDWPSDPGTVLAVQEGLEKFEQGAIDYDVPTADEPGGWSETPFPPEGPQHPMAGPVDEEPF